MKNKNEDSTEEKWKKNLFISTFMLIIATICTRGSSLKDMPGNNSLRIFIPFNNCVPNSNLDAGFGFSAWIEFKEKVIVFDTGSDYLTLLENMEKNEPQFHESNMTYLFPTTISTMFMVFRVFQG